MSRSQSFPALYARRSEDEITIAKNGGGAHLDLIGGYRPDMREADDAAVKRSRIYIDTDAALAEAGVRWVNQQVVSPS